MQCPDCRAENVPDARFCNQCGARFTAPVAAEHRQITVMFADLVGSTELATRLGPEDWRETVRRFQQASGECVARFEGTIAQYLGDGVLVYFGHPVAHEDDPERALRAGLALLERIEALNEQLTREYGVQIRARLAAHTGSVVIGEMGGPARRENLALGEAPNIAARLQECAPHDSLVTSAATLALAPGRFDVEDLGERELKGVREPMSVYRVVREASTKRRFAGDTGRTLSPLVGRARELAALRAAFDDAARGDGQLIWITGEPGIGKSRLVHELQRGIGDMSHHWLDLHASAYAQHSAFEPLRVLLSESVAGEADDARERLADLLDVAARPRAEESRLLGPENRRAATIAAFGDWLLALSAKRPVVLAVEDFHAVDPSTVEALERAVERTREARILIAVTARSGTKAPDGWREHATSLELEPLARGDLADLIAGTARDASLPDDVRAAVIERSDGNPLFAEELLRAAGGAGAATAVPATLRDPLRARLDRTGAAQATAQLASALGREFSYALVRAVSKLDDAALQADLEQLVEAALIFEQPSSGGRTYQFRHALLRDSAYGSMLRRARMALHADIARALKERFGDLARARPELLAHHFAAAGDHANALVNWLRASNRSTEACAYREVLSQVEMGLESLALLPEGEHGGSEMKLLIHRGNARRMLHGQADDGSLAAFQRARALAESVDDPAGACVALLGVYGAIVVSGTTREAAEICDELLDRARLSGQVALLKHANMSAGLNAFASGDFPRAHEHLEAAVGGFGWVAESYLLRTTWMCGEPARALELCEAFAERVRGEGAGVRVEVLLGVGITYLLAGLYERALAYAREGVTIARRESMVWFLGQLISLEGAAVAGLGDAASGIERFESAESVLGRRGVGFWGSFWASAILDAGDVGGAIALADYGLAEEARYERHLCEADLLRVKGEAQARLAHGAPEAEATLFAAVRSARRRGARGWELRAALALGRFLCTHGRYTEARDVLEPTYSAFREGFDQSDLVAARQILSRLDSRD